MKAILETADEYLPDPLKAEMMDDTPQPMRGEPNPFYYREMKAMLHGLQVRRIQAKPLLQVVAEGEDVVLKLYDTPIIRVSPDGKAVVTVGQGATATTAKYMEAYLPGGWRLYYKTKPEKRLYWHSAQDTLQGTEQPMSDGDTIDSVTGVLRPRTQTLAGKLKSKKILKDERTA